MTRRILNRKQRIFARISPARFTIICPSRWLAREAGRSAICQRFDTRIIPNGVDQRDFFPVEQTEARRRFNLPTEARIVLFVADQIEDRRKGFRFLLKAFDAIRAIPGLLLVTLGRGDTSFLTGSLFRHLGPMHDTGSLRTAYSAADVFAIPSLQDNLPNTILESMACGTPVAGFDAGGVGEAVIDGQTGLLAPTGDASAFAASLRAILEDRMLQRALGGESLARVGREYTVILQARRYAALYRKSLSHNPPEAGTRTQSHHKMKSFGKFLLAGMSATPFVLSFATPASPAIDDQRFGVMTHFAHGWDPSWIPLIAQDAIPGVRDELYWQTVEPQAGDFVFPGQYDQYMAGLKQNNISPLIVLSFRKQKLRRRRHTLYGRWNRRLCPLCRRGTSTLWKTNPRGGDME